MPIYEYLCQHCAHPFEVMQKIGDRPFTRCPNCHKKKLIKKVSSTSFVLKGTGWYKTDYAPKEAKGKKETETKPASPEKPTGKPTPEGKPPPPKSQ